MTAVALTLPETADLESAKVLAADLKKAGTSASICVDAGAVATMSTPVALTLVSAVRSREADAPALRIENATPPFLEAFSDLGLFSDLMKMEFPT